MSINFTNPWDVRNKYSSKFSKQRMCKNFVPHLITQSPDAIRQHLAEVCEEISVSELPKLAPGTCITYQNVKEGKIIMNVSVMLQIITKAAGVKLTRVGYLNNGSYISAKGRKQVAAGGNVKLPRFGQYSWFISETSICKLYRVKTDNDFTNDQVGELRQQLDEMKKQMDAKNEELKTMFKIIKELKRHLPRTVANSETALRD